MTYCCMIQEVIDGKCIGLVYDKAYLVGIATRGIGNQEVVVAGREVMDGVSAGKRRTINIVWWYSLGNCNFNTAISQTMATYIDSLERCYRWSVQINKGAFVIYAINRVGNVDGIAAGCEAIYGNCIGIYAIRNIVDR